MSFGALGRIIILKSAETLRLWLKADASRRQNGPRKQRLWRGEHSAARRKPVLPKKEERSKSGVMPRGSQAANVGEKTRSGKSFQRIYLNLKDSVTCVKNLYNREYAYVPRVWKTRRYNRKSHFCLCRSARMFPSMPAAQTEGRCLSSLLSG